MKRIQFLGAAGMVTGSSYLLRDDGDTALLLDMGVFQGVPQEEAHNNDPLAFDPRSLSGVVLTHAHQDHCGRLPLLAKQGFSGRIYMTPATRELLEISLFDSAKIAKEDSRRTSIPPAFDEKDVQKILDLAVTVDYGHSFDISRYSLVFKDAGHILGSASVVLTDNSREDAIQTIVFSGDLGNTPQDLIRPTELIDEADVVIMESTYGDRSHAQDIPQAVIQAEIQALDAKEGTLLLPAFSIERTQVILHLIGHMKDAGLIHRDLPVFLDSPMAEKVTEVYRQFPRLYSEELARHAQKDDPFDFPGLKVIADHTESKRLHEMHGAKVIIAGSGMMSGGRILDHARHFLPRPSTRLLFVGYQAVGTIGRKIEEGAGQVRIYGDDVDVAAAIHEVKGMSAHADQPRLVSWINAIEGVKKIFLTHGEEEPRRVLADKIKTDKSDVQIILPALLEDHPL